MKLNKNTLHFLSPVGTVYDNTLVKAGQIWEYRGGKKPKYKIHAYDGKLFAVGSDGFIFNALPLHEALRGCVLVHNPTPPVNPPLQADILAEVVQERDRQDTLFGAQNHIPIIWANILAEEFGEVAMEANDIHFKYANDETEKAKAKARYREELIQVAAVAVAMIESLDRNEGYE